MNIYLACGLTHVPRHLFGEYTSAIHEMAGSLTRHDGHQVKYALVNSDPQLASKPFNERARLCYLWDRQMVQDADLVIGECSFPAIGLGIELQHASENETPIILIYRDYGENQASPVAYVNPDHSKHDLQIGEGYISLMALGLPTVVRVHRYQSVDDGISQIRSTLELIQR